MGVIEPGRSVGLPPESLLVDLIVGEIGGQQLQGDIPGVDRIVSLPHLTHAATAQQLNQAVATEWRPARIGLPCHGQDISDPPQPTQSIRQAAPRSWSTSKR